MKKEETKKVVRKGYAKIAREKSSCCAPAPSCCGTDTVQDTSKMIGYTDKELKALPEGANLGLGCGNPVALASLKHGETVLDLGAGAGIDCFLAAEKVGKKGKVIGIDMTPEMLEKARENLKKSDHSNIEFRLGEIENLPVDDNSVDVIISNCVINLSPDKQKVFRETFRVLKPGGRIMVSDIVVLKELPDALKNSVDAYVGCIAGAITKDDYLEAVTAAGFQDVRVIDETSFPVESWVSAPTTASIVKDSGMSFEEVQNTVLSVLSIKVHAVKNT